MKKQKQKYEIKDITTWVEWLCKNPELAEKHYPELTTALKEKIQHAPPYSTALVIQKLPEQFNKWKTHIDQQYGITRQKKIKEYIYLLDGVLNEWEYPTEIENKAVDEVRDELTEQLLYWKNELNDLPHQQATTNRTKQLIVEKLEAIDKDGWKYAFKSETDFNTFTDLLTNFFEYKEYNLPAEIIQLQRNCKTKLGKVLGEIYKELNENPLKSNDEYFKILQCLNHFKNETDLYKVLTR